MSIDARLAAENAILGQCRANPDGIPDAELAANIDHIPVSDRAQAINQLLSSRKLQIFKDGDTIVYREVKQDEAVKFKGLSSEDLLIHQIIQSSGNMGIWTKELKQKSNLPQAQISKIFKDAVDLKKWGFDMSWMTLASNMTQHYMKAVKHVAQQNRKVYMLYELEPSREITGGAWYTEHEYDSEFIHVLREQCVKFILARGKVGREQCVKP